MRTPPASAALQGHRVPLANTSRGAYTRYGEHGRVREQVNLSLPRFCPPFKLLERGHPRRFAIAAVCNILQRGYPSIG